MYSKWPQSITFFFSTSYIDSPIFPAQPGPPFSPPLPAQKLGVSTHPSGRDISIRVNGRCKVTNSNIIRDAWRIDASTTMKEVHIMYETELRFLRREGGFGERGKVHKRCGLPGCITQTGLMATVFMIEPPQGIYLPVDHPHQPFRYAGWITNAVRKKKDWSRDRENQNLSNDVFWRAKLPPAFSQGSDDQWSGCKGLHGKRIETW